MRAPRFTHALALAGFLLFVETAAMAAEDASAVQRGNAAFQRACAACHGRTPGSDGRALLPGTDALRLKYKGALPALLEARADLTAVTIKLAVRRGSFSMPPFRKTELTDREIDDIVAYLATSPLAAAD